MLLKGATPDHEGDERPDRWPLDAGAGASWRARWGIDPERDLRKTRRCGLSAADALGLLQQVRAALERLGVLGARLVEALGVVLEVGSGRARRRRSGRSPSPGCWASWRRAAARAEAVERAAAERAGQRGQRPRVRPAPRSSGRR